MAACNDVTSDVSRDCDVAACHETPGQPRLQTPAGISHLDSSGWGQCDAGPVINSNKFIHLYLSLSFRDCAGNVTQLSAFIEDYFGPSLSSDLE